MLRLDGGPRLLLCLRPTDMRRSFSGLSALVYAHRGRPDDGACYVFVNRRRTQAKVLYWDGDGLALWHKRLETGRFALLLRRGGGVEVDRLRLTVLLQSMVRLRRPPESCRKNSSKRP